MPALESSQFSRETNPRASPAPKEGSSQSIAQSAAANTLRGHLSQQGEGKELWGGGKWGTESGGRFMWSGAVLLKDRGLHSEPRKGGSWGGGGRGEA